MNNKALKILNPLLFTAFLVVAVSMLIYKLGPGDEIVGKVHEVSGIIFFLLAIAHIILNRTWIMSQIFGKKKTAARK